MVETEQPRATKAWVLFWITTALFVVWILGGVLIRPDRSTDWGTSGFWSDIGFAVVIFSFPLAGIAIARHRPDNTIAWLLLWNGFIWALPFDLYARYGLLAHPGSLPFADWVAGGTQWLWVPAIGLSATYLLFLFPDGHLPSPRWRWFAWAVGIVLAVISLLILFSPGMMEDGGYPGVRNPWGIEAIGGFLDAAQVLLILIPIAIIGSLIGLVMRFRRSQGAERLQFKWLVAAAAVITTIYAIAIVGSMFLPADTGWLLTMQNVAILSFALIPVAIGVAVLKYRLYEIDGLIAKAVVYFGLAAFITTVYVGLVVGLGRLVGAGGQNAVLSLIATAVIAVAFQPMRVRVQHLANRLVYGARSTPYEVLAGLSSRLSESFALDDLLPRIARGLSEATGGRAVVWVRTGDRLIPGAMWPAGASLPEPVHLGSGGLVPVQHQGEQLGALSVEKARGESVTPTEQRLIEELAGQAGLVLRNVTLTEDLRATIEELRDSRRRIVAAQDERAKKLERDLHDGAQQQLVALGIKLRLVTMLLERDPGKATTTLTELQADAQDAVETLRALAHGIYPPLLADQGLGAALQAQARRAAVPTTVHVDGTGRYSPEVEAAVYFCTLEALTNIAKYAHASRAQIHLEPNGSTLTFRIVDDGAGFDRASVPRGSGLQGMVDRIDAVGGSIAIESSPGSGTTVVGTVPVV
jgi:signal transduction histidine kinase